MLAIPAIVRHALVLLSVISLATAGAVSAAPKASRADASIMFGVAYYDEYSPYERLDEDMRMMKAAHITVIRIGESTWGTMEPQEGVYDFTHIDRVLKAADKAGIKVIVGTPTYAIPTWMARKYPDVLATTSSGKNKYGSRQNMDITNPDFRRIAEKTIRAMIGHVRDHPAVIGYQIDNETKAYGVSGASVQAGFVKSMQTKFPDLNNLNQAYGLNYWSNRINTWEDFPATDGSINASLSNAFAAYQRDLVTDYLQWQSDIVRELKRPDQFITQNFDMGWQGASYGIQPEVDHFAAARALDVAGIDIYHPTQDKLTGAEIAFGGDLARSMKGGQNYYVIETQAQGFPEWTPYPGQLRLQAFSHIASGANMVSYWHWTTTGNAIETYWRGLLSQDYAENATYKEAQTIGADLQRIGPKLVNLKKDNKVAFYVSNRALTAFDSFKPSGQSYNNVLRPFYDALYRMNIEADFVDPSVRDLSRYKLIIVPALYAASDEELDRLNTFARNGGHVVYTFKSGYSDENTKVRSTMQPGRLSEATGVTYSQFTVPEKVGLKGNPFGVDEADNQARWWMEFLTPTTAEVLATYDHPAWGKYAAATVNTYGKGRVTYIGFMPSAAVIDKLMEGAVRKAGLWEPAQSLHFPIILRSGVNTEGRQLHYVLNYSATPQTLAYPFGSGTDLLTGHAVAANKALTLPEWGAVIVEETGGRP